MNHEAGTGSTPDLSLRVSVAALVRVVFQHPLEGEWMLALERKAFLGENGVEVRCQPFGGAIRILDVDALRGLIGDFHFDSQRSRAEQDFRLFIRPSDWPVLRQFCIQHLNHAEDAVLETDPARELMEEFAEALRFTLQPEHFTGRPLATLVENEATPTGNMRAKGMNTVRVYRVFEAVIACPPLAYAIQKNSEDISDQQLGELAQQDARQGGSGRANAVLAVPLRAVTSACLALPPQQRNFPIFFEGHYLEETVIAVLEGITVPKYQRL